MSRSHLELSFVTEATLGSAMIRWFTHSDFSHVDIITPDGYRLGARSDHPVWVPEDPNYQPTMREPHTGVQKRAMDYAKFTLDRRLIIPCSATQADHAYGWLYEQLGKPYDKRGLFASFLFDRPVPWWDEKEWWCSELAAVFVHNAGFTACRTPASRVSPNDAFIYAGCFAKP